jgi:hypothetical protein
MQVAISLQNCDRSQEVSWMLPERQVPKTIIRATQKALEHARQKVRREQEKVASLEKTLKMMSTYKDAPEADNDN